MKIDTIRLKRFNILEQTLVIFFVSLFVSGISNAQIYYGSDDNVVATAKNGIDTTVISSERPRSIVVDNEGGYIYWSEFDFPNKVKRAKLDGSDESTILFGGFSRSENPAGMAYDNINNKLYVADNINNGFLLSSNPDGTGLDTLVAGSDNGVTNGILDIALDLKNKKIYWVKTGGVMRANLDGSNVETVVTLKSYIQPPSIALNTKDGYVYWVNTANDNIMRASINNGTAEKLLHADAPDGISLSLDEGKIYWVNSYFSAGNNGIISRANLDGTGIEHVLNIGTPTGAIYVEGLNITAINDSKNKKSILDNFVVEHNYPNPFNPSTKIKYSLPSRSQITVKIYSSIGSLVKTLLNDVLQNSGWHEITFNADNLSSGTYFYSIKSGSNIITRKMILIK